MRGRSESLYFTSCGAFVLGGSVAVMAMFLSRFGVDVTGGGHGSFTLFWIGVAFSVTAWISFLFSVITAGVLHNRGRTSIPWRIPAALLFIGYPFAWFWFVRLR